MKRARNENGLTEHQQEVLDSISSQYWVEIEEWHGSRQALNLLKQKGFIKRRLKSNWIKGEKMAAGYEYKRVG